MMFSAGFSFFAAIMVLLMLDLWLYQSTIDVSPARSPCGRAGLGIGPRPEVPRAT